MRAAAVGCCRWGRRGGRETTLVAGVVAMLLTIPSAAQETPLSAAENRRCLECHGRADLDEMPLVARVIMVAPGPDGSKPSGAPDSTRPGLYLGPDGAPGSRGRVLPTTWGTRPMTNSTTATTPRCSAGLCTCRRMQHADAARPVS